MLIRSFRPFLKFITLLLGCLFAALTQTELRAQTTTGTLSGYVNDQNGAAVQQALVTVTLVQQNVTRSTESNEEGFYNFAALQPGVYTLSVEKSGFQRLTQTELTLTVNQNSRLDVALNIGDIQQEVKVTSEAALVDTRTQTLSGLIDDRRVVDLPINGRNVIGLARLVPGVSNVRAPQQLVDARSGPEMNVNGGRANMNLFTLNGGYFNNPSRNTGLNYPPPDAVQEFRILTHNFSAEYGRNPGSQVLVVTKAGTNDFHGSIWEFLRNDALNARNFFEERRARQKQNQFGFAVGGPIKSDKLFFFGSYQGLRDRPEAATIEAFVPNAAQRGGNFTGITLQNPVDVNGVPFADAANRPCVSNNIVNPNCISPVAVNLLKFVPVTASGTLTALAPSPRNGDMIFARIDWNPSEKHSLYGHYFRDHNNRTSPFAGGGNIAGYIGQDVTQETNMVTVNDTYTFSPNLINQLTGSYLRSTSLQAQNKNIEPTSLGINMPQYVPSGGVSIDVGGLFNLGSDFTNQFLSNSYQFRDTVNWLKGNHNFKFGGEYLHLEFLQAFIGSPTFVFTGSRSGDAVADFLLGAYDNLSLNFGNRLNDLKAEAPSFFFQDEFKVHRRLSLTYGLRYEPYLPWKDKKNRINTVVPGVQSVKVPDAPPGVLFPGDPGVPDSLTHADLNNFAPRLGFAWDVFGDGRTSIRGGYGFFYESINADSLAQENPPFAGFASAFNGRIENPFTSVGQTAPPAETSGDRFGCVKISTYPGYRCDLFPLPVGGVFIDTNLRSPYIQSWNIGVQKQLSSNFVIEAAYVGKIGTKIEALRTYNPARFINSPVTGKAPSPENANERVIYEPGILSPVGFLLGNDYRSWYHSLQTQVTRRFTEGLSVTASYTLSKSIDMSSTDTLGATVANPFNLRDERGRSNWDRRHVLVASWLWSPNWKFDRSWQNTVLNGWTLTGIHSFQSGLPITFIQGDDVALDGTFGDQHAVLTGAPIERQHNGHGDMVAQFFNTSAFVPTNSVPRGVYGNAGRGLISGPANYVTDFSVLKDFAWRERYRIQFRSEFFNVFNQVNFDNPDARVNSGAFGRIRSAQPGRVIQFGLKLLF